MKDRSGAGGDAPGQLRSELVWFLRYLHLRGYDADELAAELATLADRLAEAEDDAELADVLPEGSAPAFDAE